MDHLRDNHPREHARWGSAVDILLQLSSPEALSGAARETSAALGAQTSSEVSEQHAPAATDSSGSRLGVWAALGQPAAVREGPGLAVPGAQTEHAEDASGAAVDQAVLAAATAAQENLLQRGRRCKSPAQAPPRCTSSNCACNHLRVHWLGGCMSVITVLGYIPRPGLHRALIAAWICSLEHCQAGKTCF